MTKSIEQMTEVSSSDFYQISTSKNGQSFSNEEIEMLVGRSNGAEGIILYTLRERLTAHVSLSK